MEEEAMSTSMETVPATTGTARVPLEHPGSTLARVMNYWTRRSYGQEMEPMLALLHHRKVMTSVARFEMGVAKWSRLDPRLKELACVSVASQIGCSWCMDFGYYVSRTNGMDRTKLERVLDWRSSTVYTPLERKVLEYAEAMTATPPGVTDEMVEGLRADLDDAQLIELTEMISVENLRSRTNSALGLTSQGFKSQCDLPRT
jgi:AhpD family alkylhydroperoxidase